MENIKSILSLVVDNLEYSGLLDVFDFTTNPKTKTEIKFNTINVSESGEAGACGLKVRVLVGSEADNVLRTKETLMSGFYPLVINSTFFKALSACDDLVKIFGSLNATLTVASTVVETQPNFSREANASEKMARVYSLVARCDVEPNIIRA